MSRPASFNYLATSYSASPASPYGGVEKPHRNAVYSPIFVQVRRRRCIRAGGVGRSNVLAQHAHVSTFNVSHKLLKKKEGIQGVQGAQVCTRARLAHHHDPAYSHPVTAKSVTGRGNPSNLRRTGAATALFCCVTPSQFYGGRVGRASAWPGSSDPGFPPRHVRRLNRVETIGGGSLHLRNLS